MRALHVPVGGPPEVVDLAEGGGARFMRSLRAIIGADFVEPIRITDRWEFWLDENGRAAGKQVNPAATRVARAFGFQFSLYGTAVVTGMEASANKAAGLSSDQVDAVLRRITASN